MTIAEKDLEAVRTCLAWVLRPVVRLMVRYQLPLQEFVDVLKAVYVEVAARDVSNKGRAVSDSKISAITGVHRADVAELREKGAPKQFPPPTELWRICNAWSSLEKFEDRGFARPLRYENDPSVAGQSSSFSDLVRTVIGSGDSAASALETLLQHQIVSRDEAGLLLLNGTWLGQMPALSDRMSGLAFRLHDALAPRVENEIAGNYHHPTWTVFSVAAPAFLADQLRERVMAQARPMLGEWNTMVTRAEAQLNAGQPMVRATISLLVYSEPIGAR